MPDSAGDTTVAILLVDDDHRNLIALAAMLDDLGLRIVTASTADDALRQVLLHDFALILLDVLMPGMDGVELASVIRSRERTRRVPIIFITAFDQGDELVRRGYAVGAVDFLFKPPVPEVLRSKVLGFVDLHRKTKEVEFQAAQLRAAEREAHERRLAELGASMEAAALRNEMAASKRMNDRLQLLAGVATELLGRTDPVEVVDTLAARFIQHLGYEVCVGFELHDEHRLRLISAAGTEELGWNHAWVELDDTPAMRTVFGERSRFVSDDLADQQLPEWLAELGLSACAAFPILAAGKAIGMLLCGRRSAGAVASEDLAAIQLVCDQIALATERDQLMKALREHADALSDAHRRKDEFLAMLAHELRNPLAPMSYAIDLLQASTHDSDSAALHDVLQRQLTHLSRMVDDLLDVSRITSGKIDLELAEVTIQHAVLHALETSRPQLDKHNHHVEVELPEEELVLRADATRLTQVIANLLNNAARYTDPGGRIVISAARDGNRVQVQVRDNGRGISAHVLPRVFDLFVQAERTRDRSQGGLGLGLTLVRRLVEMHGGTVSAASAGPDRGSQFTVSLPLAEPDSLAPRPAAPTVRFPNLRRGNGLAILVVEDNEDSRDMLQLLLEARGHHVDVAADGTAGLAELLTCRHDVALLDIGLPGVDGYEVARRLREQRPDRGTRLIAITGYGQGEDRARALAAGFDEHLVKPVSVDDLERVLPAE
ncbi:MAG: response regulator [Deltaproteobacteria bacterium]|nr:response regulator [Nannocystaceae bacterium]